jgi:hypothetical protein
MSIFIPNDIPIDFMGVAKVITFIDPTFIKDIPAETIARYIETAIYEECDSDRIQNPTIIITDPAIIGFMEPMQTDSAY